MWTLLVELTSGRSTTAPGSWTRWEISEVPTAAEKSVNIGNDETAVAQGILEREFYARLKNRLKQEKD